ncbi:MAG: hypothetical protein H7X80_02370 [bacterium]|nr:hypothetical protein [Candidatus Kapabacteria bacterium]
MTKNFATRALMIVGLMIAGTVASYSQSVTAQSRRVAFGAEHRQPVAVSAVALSTPSMSLTESQRTQIAAISGPAASLSTERARLWAEYNAVIARPDFDDALALSDAAPRMLRIVAINNQLAGLVRSQEAQVNALLSSTQRTEAAKAMTAVRGSFSN